MKGTGRDMKTVFSTCIQAAVAMGFMLSGIPFGVAACSVTPCGHPGSTQTESTKTHIFTSGHVNSHADITVNKSAHAGQPKGTLKTNSVNHKPATKTFDMNMLIERLKKTDAIGMFTKLAIRSDALDIIDMIKAYNKHMARYSLQELRARFNGLVLKVLALLDNDPQLSRDISLAREDIWKSLLTQEVKA